MPLGAPYFSFDQVTDNLRVTMTTKLPPSNDILNSIQGILFDCDGVLTDGGLLYDQNGNCMLRFHARDGFGLAIFSKVAGLKAGVLSGRPTAIAEKRFGEIGVTAFKGSSKDKYNDSLQLCEELSIEPEKTAFVGDDIPDLPAFRAVGLKVAVGNASEEVKQAADWILQSDGGQGAAREICETILRARGDWQAMLERK